MSVCRWLLYRAQCIDQQHSARHAGCCWRMLACRCASCERALRFGAHHSMRCGGFVSHRSAPFNRVGNLSCVASSFSSESSLPVAQDFDEEGTEDHPGCTGSLSPWHRRHNGNHQSSFVSRRFSRINSANPGSDGMCAGMVVVVSFRRGPFVELHHQLPLNWPSTERRESALNTIAVKYSYPSRRTENKEARQ